MTTYTGYKATKVINERLEDEGLSTIPPQMIYTYISKNMIETEVIEGKKQIAEGTLNEWLEGYVEMRHTKEARKQEKLEAELEGSEV